MIWGGMTDSEESVESVWVDCDTVDGLVWQPIDLVALSLIKIFLTCIY